MKIQTLSIHPRESGEVLRSIKLFWSFTAKKHCSILCNNWSRSRKLKRCNLHLSPAVELACMLTLLAQPLQWRDNDCRTAVKPAVSHVCLVNFFFFFRALTHCTNIYCNRNETALNICWQWLWVRLQSHYQTHETYETFTVIIPGNKLKVSWRYSSEFQSKQQLEKEKHCLHKWSKFHNLQNLVLSRLLAWIIWSTFTVYFSSNLVSKELPENKSTCMSPNFDVE